MKKKCVNGFQPGQALVEYVLTLPVLIIILVSGFSMGMAFYQAHMASDAIRAPNLQKIDIAGKDCVEIDHLEAMVNQSNLSGSLNTGKYIDDVTLTGTGNYTRVLVGHKRITPAAGFLPTMDVYVTQVVNRNLLDANPTYGGGVLEGAGCNPAPTSSPPPPNAPRSSNMPWVPYGAPVDPPW